MSSKYFAIIPAAGSGVRFGGDVKKQFRLLKGRPLLEWTLEVFIQADLFDEIIVCLPADELNDVSMVDLPASVTFIEGAKTRSESVYEGFKSLRANDEDIVLIHDAVRPLVSIDLIQRVIQETLKKKAVVPAVPITDTVKVASQGIVKQTINRDNLVCVQTPQGFSCSLLKKMYASKPDLSSTSTDEAMLIENMGEKVYIVEGERKNIKVTTPFDMDLASSLVIEDIEPTIA